MARGKSYEEFVEKFKPKKTTDDCYTPENIYQAVLGWVRNEYTISDATRIIRPFYPGGDYTAADYSGDCVVVDNPPFSILSQICRWYNDRGIRFFLFAPALTLFSVSAGKCNYVVSGANITYENGAIVNTSFITNMGDTKIHVCSELHDVVDVVNKSNEKADTKPQPKYNYPDHVATSARLEYIAVHGASLKINDNDVCFVRRLDSQKEKGRSLFGGGFLLSNRAVADRVAAERAAAERVAAERAAADRVYNWQLSDRERKIIERLGKI